MFCFKVVRPTIEVRPTILEENGLLSMRNQRHAEHSAILEETLLEVIGGKTDPSLNTISKIADALNVSSSELIRTDEIFDDVNNCDKTLIEKLQHLDSLNEDEKNLFIFL